MKIKKKRTLKLFGIIDVVAIEEYLENMAAGGWIFNGCSGIFYTFIKGEPQNLKYHVSLFHDGSAFGSNGDNIETKQYAAEWEAQGWRFVYANGRQVFFVLLHLACVYLSSGVKCFSVVQFLFKLELDVFVCERSSG